MASTADRPSEVSPAKPLRADAQRNRELVLRTAAEIFATEGLSVPVHEIARRAGVGTGTVSRHFPTKEDLFVAVLLEQMRLLADFADTLAAEQGAGAAFISLFTRVIREGAAHRGLAEALAGAGFEVETVAEEAGFGIATRLRALLARAQQDGTVRTGITYADIKALMTGCLARAADDNRSDAAGRDIDGGLDRVIAVVVAGLRPLPGSSTQ
ncbi:MAG TPA: TetR family transcriptional regulator [Pseudonocardiaceae bacterium]